MGESEHPNFVRYLKGEVERGQLQFHIVRNKNNKKLFSRAFSFTGKKGG